MISYYSFLFTICAFFPIVSPNGQVSENNSTTLHVVSAEDLTYRTCMQAYFDYSKKQYVFSEIICQGPCKSTVYIGVGTYRHTLYLGCGFCEHEYHKDKCNAQHDVDKFNVTVPVQGAGQDNGTLQGTVNGTGLGQNVTVQGFGTMEECCCMGQKCNQFDNSKMMMNYFTMGEADMCLQVLYENERMNYLDSVPCRRKDGTQGCFIAAATHDKDKKLIGFCKDIESGTCEFDPPAGKFCYPTNVDLHKRLYFNLTFTKDLKINDSYTHKIDKRWLIHPERPMRLIRERIVTYGSFHFVILFLLYAIAFVIHSARENSSRAAHLRMMSSSETTPPLTTSRDLHSTHTQKESASASKVKISQP